MMLPRKIPRVRKGSIMELWETRACEDGWREKGEGMTGEVRAKPRKNMGKEITES